MINVNIGFILRNLANLTKKMADTIDEDHELTGFQKYLIGFLVIEGRKRDIFQKDVEKHLEISRSSVTSALKTLEKNGYIVRESVKSDARLKKIVVTDKAIRGFERGKIAIEATEKVLLKGISDEELVSFISVADKIKKNLEESLCSQNKNGSC